jgi:hypothetical protein
MRTVVRSVAWVAVFVAVGAAAISWLTPRPDLDAADAEATALGALDEVGVDGTVDEPVERSQHATADGDELDVWVVYVDVDAPGDTVETVETRVLLDAGQLVYVDDRIGPDRQERLLSDDDFAAVADYRHDATLGDWVTANVGAMIAAALVAVTGYVIAKRSDPVWRTA